MQTNQPAWYPQQTDNISANSNIWRFMQQHKLANYEQLFDWSITKRDKFWEDAIAAVNIQFMQPYTKILDLTHGVEQPSWLINAKLNIVNSCFKAPKDKTAIVYKDHSKPLQSISYGQLHALTNQVSNSLAALGIKPGDAVGIDMIMTVESVAIYLGIIQAGCVAVGIADSFATPEIAKRLSLSNAKLVFTQDVIQRDAKTLPLYEKVVAANADKIIVLPSDSNKLAVKLRGQDLSWQDFLITNSHFTSVVCNPHDPATILFSSGTTGEPKAIVWDHTSPIKCAVDGYFYQDIQTDDIVAWPTSLGWMMGAWLIYATLINQACIGLYYDIPTTRNFTEFVANSGVTILGVVPSLVKAWRVNKCCVGLDWSKIKLFTSTGETSNYSDMLFLMQQAGNKPVIEYCGGTEIAGAYITSTVVQPNIPAAFSTPTLGLDLRLIEKDNTKVKYVDKGEVAIIPPSIGLSRVLLNRDNYEVYYASMPKTMDGLVLRKHGDEMQRLDNGYYRSLGRADDTMNLGGIKISAAEIENCLQGIGQVSETAAVGNPGTDGITQLIIFVVPIQQVQLDLEVLKKEMQQAINQKLNPLFKISEIRIITEIPRTSSNKIMRRVLRDSCIS